MHRLDGPRVRTVQSTVDPGGSPSPSGQRSTQLRWLPTATRLVVRIPAAVGLVALVVVGVVRLPGDDSDLAATLVEPLQRVTPATDRVEVWACRVPADSTAELYGGLPLRTPIDVEQLAAMFDRDVAAYFVDVSHGLYAPTFVAGGEVDLGPTDGYEECVDVALAASSGSASVVLAIADAEHASGLPGGFGSAGVGCALSTPCAAAESRRYAYVGAADFSAAWGDAPPLDLVEHELGHTLGWVHSGMDIHGSYQSALDVMSNSAWPRAVDSTRRHAPDTIGIQRLIAGWLRDEEVRVADGDETVTLVPSNARPLDLYPAVLGTRLLVLPVDTRTFLTVEVLLAAGYDDHLPAAGVAVHRVRLAVEDPSLVEAVDPLTNDGALPFDRLLESRGSLDADGWRIVVAEWSADGWVVSVERVAD